MVVVMVGGEGVGEGAVVVEETTGSPGGEEEGDGVSPSTLVGEVIVVVTIHAKTLKILEVLLYSTTLLTYTETDYGS